jgi:RimJ/RimL family protein N-acetyltransferase
MPGPVVEEGERVTLRTVERDDAAFLQRSRTDPRIRWPLGAIHHGNRAESEDAIENWLEGDSAAAYLACVDEPDAPRGHPEDDETTPVGTVTARNLDGDRPWLAYWLLPKHHGEGYGGEMVELAVDTLFRAYDIHGVSAGAYGFNEASRGLLESLGFVEEARRREARFVDGTYRDEVQYGVLREEWEDR